MTVSWRSALVLLLLTMPFVGGLSLIVGSPLVLVVRDVLFVVPAYLGAFLLARDRTPVAMPPVFWLAVAALAFLVSLQTVNPGIHSLLVAAVGMKVWLFYIPLLFVTAKFIRDDSDIVRLLRVMVSLSLLPCIVAWLQFLGSHSIGYETTMEAFYGDAAAGATQNFARFDFGAGQSVYRIPGTFSYPTQMFGYLFAMIVAAYALADLDVSPRWRAYARFMTYCLMATAMIIGIRTAWVFVPMLFAITLWAHGKLGNFVGVGLSVVLVALSAFSLAGLHIVTVFGTTIWLIDHYAETLIFRSIEHALTQFPFGIGTGMNTGAARHVFPESVDSETFLSGVESYYAKSIIELGIPGLLVVIALFVSLIYASWRINRAVRGPLRGLTAALFAFFFCMAVNSLKGWQIDFDPINFLFWIYAGMLARVSVLAQETNTIGAGAPLQWGRSQAPRQADSLAKANGSYR